MKDFFKLQLKEIKEHNTPYKFMPLSILILTLLSSSIQAETLNKPPIPEDIPIFTFTLNHKNMSIITTPILGNLDAFSGQKDGRNNPNMTNIEDIGPLPKGIYYIVKRPEIHWNEQANLYQKLRILWHITFRFCHDMIESLFQTPSSDWFALYRYDEDGLNDYTTIKKDQEKPVTRGFFRLHPLDPSNQSRGCITLSHKEDFYKIRHYLLNRHKNYIISDIHHNIITAYGIIIVK